MAEKMLEQFGQMVRSSEQYPADFDQAWQWVGYVRKDYALDTLKANFEERLDYSGVDRNRSNRKPGKPYRAYFLINRNTGKLPEGFIPRHLLKKEEATA
ncbi:MAG: hypothetical protein LBB78_09270 [Spirochaetaceae bacterium]|jgi:hypothetical protein|nr:hypothetical protein [Spirochaetaceae bacterium]